MVFGKGNEEDGINEEETKEILYEYFLKKNDFSDKKILVTIPDTTRSGWGWNSDCKTIHFPIQFRNNLTYCFCSTCCSWNH